MMRVEWEWQRFGQFRGLVEAAWIVYLTGGSQALPERHATEFDAMLAAEAALDPGR